MRLNKPVSEMRVPLAARREAAGGPEQVGKFAICFWTWNENILIHAPHTRIVALWQISNIPPRIS